MHRRDVLRSLFFRTSTANTSLNSSVPVTEEIETVNPVTPNSFISKWHFLAGAGWAAQNICGHCLQDWGIKSGELNCVSHAADRMMHILTHQLCAGNTSFKATIILRFLDQPGAEDAIEDFAGFRLGFKVRLQDYHQAVVKDKGVDAGVTRNGFLFIGKTFSTKKIDEKILAGKIRLQLSVTPLSTGGNFAKLKALDNSGNTIATHSSSEYDAIAWHGNIAMVSHFKRNKETRDQPTIAISQFEIEGEKIMLHLKNNPAGKSQIKMN